MRWDPETWLMSQVGILNDLDVSTNSFEAISRTIEAFDELRRSLIRPKLFVNSRKVLSGLIYAVSTSVSHILKPYGLDVIGISLSSKRTRLFGG